MINNPQKGVSLIITFFITIIILFVVLAVTAILYSEIKVIRNVGNSVVAFYAADSGVEKALYFNRKLISATAPEDAQRGMCSMCASSNPTCPTGETTDENINCICNGAPVGPHCSPDDCTYCTVSFDSIFNDSGKRYNVVMSVTPSSDPLDPTASLFNVRSTGSYENVKRAVELNTKEGGVATQCLNAVSIDSATANPYCVRYSYGFNTVNISVDISEEANQIDTSLCTTSPCPVTATIYNDKGSDPTIVFLQFTSGDATTGSGTWSYSWTATPTNSLPGKYYVNIDAFDSMNCTAGYPNVPPFAIETCE